MRINECLALIEHPTRLCLRQTIRISSEDVNKLDGSNDSVENAGVLSWAKVEISTLVIAERNGMEQVQDKEW